MKIKLKELFLSNYRDYIISILLLTPLAIIYWNSLDGDAAIYFTFIKNFFSKPFSYYPGEVSFDYSPLLVILYAPIYKIFKKNIGCQYLNL